MAEGRLQIPVGRWLAMRLLPRDLVALGELADSETIYLGYVYVDATAGLSMRGDLATWRSVVEAPRLTIRITAERLRPGWQVLGDEQAASIGLPVTPPWLAHYGPQPPRGTLVLTNPIPAPRPPIPPPTNDMGRYASDAGELVYTPRAVARLLAVRLAEGLPEHICLRLRIVGSATVGFAYDMFFDWPTEHDRKFDWHGLRVIVDPQVMPYLVGTEVDFQSTSTGTGFRFTNPNVKH